MNVLGHSFTFKGVKEGWMPLFIIMRSVSGSNQEPELTSNTHHHFFRNCEDKRSEKDTSLGE